MNPGSLFIIAGKKPKAEIRLFCFPHAGGGPASFFSWNALLGPRIECVSLQYPGRAQRWREAGLTSMGDLVREIAENLEEAAAGRFAFYGHSFGGLVAFEVTRRLRQDGMPGPDWLFVGATRAPQLDHWQSPIHSLPDEEFVTVLQDRYGGIPAAIRADRETLNLFLGSMRTDLKAYENYRMKEGAALAIPVTAFAGAEDHSVSPARMVGWETQTEAGFQMKVLPAGHFFTNGNLETVTNCIRDSLLERFDFQKMSGQEILCSDGEERGGCR
jgi:surfactin synthase thioesterase subunit